MTTLSGKTVWILGGGSGVGRASALALADAGASVVISGRRPEALEATRSASAGRIEIAPLDVTDAKAVQSTCTAIVQQNRRIDILVNSAGQNLAEREWHQLDPADWDLLLATNASGAFYAIRAVLDIMRPQGGGLIVNIASWGSRYPLRFAGTAYTASKSAMLAMTQTVNMEEGIHGIRACAILPAAIASEMLQKRAVPFSQEEIARMLTPEDVARVVRFVAETPEDVVVNEITVSPVRNMIYERSV